MASENFVNAFINLRVRGLEAARAALQSIENQVRRTQSARNLSLDARLRAQADAADARRRLQVQSAAARELENRIRESEGIIREERRETARRSRELARQQLAAERSLAAEQRRIAQQTAAETRRQIAGIRERARESVESIQASIRRVIRAAGTAGRGTLARLFGARLRRQIDLLNQRLVVLRQRLRRALARGDATRANAIRGAIRNLSREFGRVAGEADRAAAGIRRADAALEGLQASLTLGISVGLNALAGSANLVRRAFGGAVRFGLRTFRVALGALFAPILAIQRSLRFLFRSVLPFLTAGGLIFGIRRLASEFGEFNQQIRRATLLTGAFGDVGDRVFRGLARLSRRFAAETLFTPTEVSRTVETLVRGGLADLGELEIVLPAAIDLAIVGGSDPEEVGRFVNVIRNQFGVAVEDLTRLVDKLAIAQSRTVLTLPELQIAFEEAGNAAASSNVTFDETLGFLTLITQRLPVASKAGTAFARGLGRLQAPTGAAARTLDRLLSVTGRLRSEFFDEFGRFEEGGLNALIGALAATGASFGDFVTIFGFRAKALQGLLSNRDLVQDFDASLGQLQDVQLADLQELLEDFRNSAGFARTFREELVNKDLLSVLTILRSRVQEFAFSLFEAFNLNRRLLRVARELANRFNDAARAFTDSPQLIAFVNGFSELLTRLTQAVSAVVGPLARIIATFNAAAILVAIRGIEEVFARVNQLLDETNIGSNRFLRIMRALLSTWEGVGIVVAFVARNIDAIFNTLLTGVRLLGRAVEVELLSAVLRVVAPITNLFQSLISRIVSFFVRETLDATSNAIRATGLLGSRFVADAIALGAAAVRDITGANRTLTGQIIEEIIEARAAYRDLRGEFSDATNELLDQLVLFAQQGRLTGEIADNIERQNREGRRGGGFAGQLQQAADELKEASSQLFGLEQFQDFIATGLLTQTNVEEKNLTANEKSARSLERIEQRLRARDRTLGFVTGGVPLF